MHDELTPQTESQAEMDENPPNPKVDLRDYVDSRIDDLKELVTTRFDAIALANQVALTEINRRLEGMNEFRDQLKEERSDYVTREFFDQRLIAIERRIAQFEFGKSRDNE